MEIFLADNSGFCFGVRRAVKLSEERARETENSIASLGSIIHNPQEVERLKNLGVIPREKIDEIIEKEVIIRTHGISFREQELLENEGFKIHDCTCPYVKRLQGIAHDYAQKGYYILVFGDKNHPEVKGVLGRTLGNGQAYKNSEEIKLENKGQAICILAQTTENSLEFSESVNELKRVFFNIVVFNTICSATEKRKSSTLETLKKVEVMLIIGGRNSANTNKLFELCKDKGVAAYLVENSSELKKEWFTGIARVGITAGASTPDWIIEEVVRSMEEIKELQEKVEETQETQETEETATPEQHESEVPMEQLDQDISRMTDVKPGNVVIGTVVQINNEEVLVDVGGKSEGVIPARELSYRKDFVISENINLGDQFKVLVLKTDSEDGTMVLSKKRAESEEMVGKLESAFTNGETIEAEVTEVVKGGILVDVGIRGFIPASQIDRGYVEDLTQFIGQKLQLKIVEFDPKNRKAVLSRKKVLDEEYEAKKAVLLSELAEGQTRKGVVQRITNFGAFVDLGGIDGLLHVSEMGWNRVGHPSDVVSEGDELDVYILGVDKENEKVSLGLKQLAPSPWSTAPEKYPVGSIVEGKVVRLASFGAFVEIEPGVDGLVHVSQISWERVEKPEDAISIGQIIQTKVLEVNSAEKRMSLSIKDTLEKPIKEVKPKTKQRAPQPVYKEEIVNSTISDALTPEQIEMLTSLKN